MSKKLKFKKNSEFKIALIGSTGLVGCAIKQVLKRLDIDTLFLTHKNFEITNIEDYNVIKDFGADVVINTAAYLGVEPCEKDPVEAFKINVIAVRDLARFCDNYSICLAYISTDAVFDGKTGNYDEYSQPNPINMYGLTKYSGELMTKNLCQKYYIIRIPILFGKRENKGNIFIEKMYSLYKNGVKELRIADDVMNRPSYNNDVAERIVQIILNKYEYGIYHIYNGGKPASLYDFAKEFFTQMNIDIHIERAKASDFAANELGRKPLNTTISSSELEPLRDWKLAINDFVKEFKE